MAITDPPRLPQPSHNALRYNASQCKLTSFRDSEHQLRAESTTIIIKAEDHISSIRFLAVHDPFVAGTMTCLSVRSALASAFGIPLRTSNRISTPLLQNAIRSTRHQRSQLQQSTAAAPFSTSSSLSAKKKGKATTDRRISVFPSSPCPDMIGPQALYNEPLTLISQL